MKKVFLLGLAVLSVTLLPPLARAQSERLETTPLNNRDVVFMVRQRLDSADIIRVIQSSPCTFDTFPPVLQELKRRGVSDAILQAMVEAPYGPSAHRTSTDDLGEAPIYHYAEQLKQMGYLLPTAGGRGQPTRQRARASRSRQRR